MSINGKPVSWIALILAFAGTAHAVQQEYQESENIVRVSVELVQVDAVVTNSKDEPVTDLTKDDFIILQDGQPQEITHFSYVLVATPPAEKQKEARTKSSSRSVPAPPPIPLRREKIQRTIALIVDDLGLSPEYAIRTRQWIKNWVAEQMQPGDLVAVIRTGAVVGTLNQFTNDKRVLNAAADAINYNAASRVGASGDFDPIAASGSISRDRFGFSQPMMSEERDFIFTKFTIQSIQRTVEDMRDFPGRRSAILITEKFQVQFNGCQGESQGRDAAMKEPMQRLIDAANRAAVVIHSVDPRGVINTSRVCELLASQDGMSILSKQTGGIFMQGHNDIDRALAKVANDGNGYYLIGYQPDSKTVSEMKKGKPRNHKIQVKVKRAGLTVRSRSEFFSTPDSMPSTDLIARQVQVQKAFVSPFKNEDIRVRLTALFSQTKDDKPVINALLHFDANQLVFSDELDGWSKAVIEITAGLYTSDGQEIDFADKTWNLQAKGQTYEYMKKNGVAFLMNVPVKQPGVYQMKLVLRDTATGKMGSSTQVVEVPNIRNGRLALSGILLAADKKKSEAAVDRAEGVIEESDASKTAAVRVFESGETIAWAYQILNAKSGKDGKPQLMAQIRMFREGKPVYEGTSNAMNSMAQEGSKRMIAADQIYLKQLPPGYYVLQIVVMDMLAKDDQRLAVQSIDFDAKDDLSEHGTDFPNKQINAGCIEASLGKDNVRVAHCRFYELQVHGADRIEVLFDDGFDAPAPRANVALESADEPEVRVAIHENFEIHQAPHTRVVEHKNAFHDYHGQRTDPDGLPFAGMRDEIVNRAVNAQALAQRFHLEKHEIKVKSVRVVKVDLLPLIERHRVKIPVIGILLQIGNRRFADRGDDFLRNGGFA
jgi:VWFA-related protein